MWKSWIVEGVTGNTKADGLSCVELDEALARLLADGWALRFVLPNGVNRWTLICWKDVA